MMHAGKEPTNSRLSGFQLEEMVHTHILYNCIHDRIYRNAVRDVGMRQE